MAKKKAAEAATENEAATEKTGFRLSKDATINFGTDGEGKPYSAENSPKKGDATKARWAVYRDGMTVQEALDGGLTPSNIRRDRRAGFITVTPAPAAPAAEAEPAE
jgi:hypothetical protein